VEADESNLGSVCGAILHYLAQHPDAADTVSGIANWWLPDAQRNVSERTIQRALERLVAHGKVKKNRLAGGTVLYSHEVANGDGKTH
jgi:Fe2+ or Zn2+ uptake regulation protein